MHLYLAAQTILLLELSPFSSAWLLVAQLECTPCCPAWPLPTTSPLTATRMPPRHPTAPLERFQHPLFA